jgi:o-succinylbenzoate synthase
MKVVSFKYTSYQIDFKQPVKTGITEISNKKGFIVEIADDKGHKGFGDASPLPLFGSENFEDVNESFEKIQSDFPKFSIEDNVESIDMFLDFLRDLPTVRHALEQALLELLIKQTGSSPELIFNKSFSDEIEVNGLIGILSPKETARKAEELMTRGYRTLKLKSGSEDFSYDYERLKEVREKIGNKLKLRIDVNGKWSFEEAINHIKRLEVLDLEFIEQPVIQTNELLELSKASSVAIAADESIRDFDTAVKMLRKDNHLNYIVIKPMLVGGILNSLKLVALAERNGKKVVISSSFESDVGRRALLLCAAASNSSLAHGLGVTENYRNYETEFPVINGKIKFHLSSLFTKDKLNFSN